MGRARGGVQGPGGVGGVGPPPSPPPPLPVVPSCGTIMRRTRCRHQTSRSLKGQHFCTSGPQCFGASSNKKLQKPAKNCEKWVTIAKSREIAKKPEPPSPAPTPCLVPRAKKYVRGGVDAAFCTAFCLLSGMEGGMSPVPRPRGRCRAERVGRARLEGGGGGAGEGLL